MSCCWLLTHSYKYSQANWISWMNKRDSLIHSGCFHCRQCWTNLRWEWAKIPFEESGWSETRISAGLSLIFEHSMFWRIGPKLFLYMYIKNLQKTTHNCIFVEQSCTWGWIVAGTVFHQKLSHMFNVFSNSLCCPVFSWTIAWFALLPGCVASTRVERPEVYALQIEWQNLAGHLLCSVKFPSSCSCRGECEMTQKLTSGRKRTREGKEMLSGFTVLGTDLNKTLLVKQLDVVTFGIVRQW